MLLCGFYLIAYGKSTYAINTKKNQKPSENSFKNLTPVLGQKFVGLRASSIKTVIM